MATRRRSARRRLETLFDEPAHRTHLRRATSTAGCKPKPDYKPQLELAAKYAAWATLTPAGQAQTQTRRAFQVAAQARPACTWCRSRSLRDNGVVKLQLHPDHWRHREGFELTDPGHGSDRRARPGALLHQVPQPGQGQLLHRPARKRTARSRHSVFGVTLAGCPLEEKISEMNVVKQHGNSDRRAGHRHHRQPDVRRHRPPHLQRLHEVLHLPEAGAGRHPAGRNAHAEGCAGAALGLRDLQPADALESAELRRVPCRSAATGYKVLVVGWARPASRWRIT